jgi:DNA-binding transcriptional MerR regulator
MQIANVAAEAMVTMGARRKSRIANRNQLNPVIEDDGKAWNGFQGQEPVMNVPMLRIGQVASATGISVDSIRYYERLGVLPPAQRSTAGYRMYSEQVINRVTLVQRALQFGFSLKELATFLKSRDAGAPPCRAVRDAAEAMLAHMEERIRDMTRARTAMRKTLRDWDTRLAKTPSNAPARLLESLPATQHVGVSREIRLRQFKRPRLADVPGERPRRRS